MAIIPSTQKFHTVSAKVDTVNRGSKLANSGREAVTMQDIVDSVSIDGITFKFPIESGQTISENDFIMLNDSGEIFEVASTGTVPISIPIGSGAEYSQTLAPSQDRDNLVRFVDNTENFILLFTSQGGTP